MVSLTHSHVHVLQLTKGSKFCKIAKNRKQKLIWLIQARKSKITKVLGLKVFYACESILCKLR